jgi:hypothetical protein
MAKSPGGPRADKRRVSGSDMIRKDVVLRSLGTVAHGDHSVQLVDDLL